jgi:hypothetical protein
VLGNSVLPQLAEGGAELLQQDGTPVCLSEFVPAPLNEKFHVAGRGQVPPFEVKLLPI